MLELCDVVAKLPVSKTGRREGEETERMHQRMDAAGYLREEQRRQPGCPAREVVLDQRGQAT